MLTKAFIEEVLLNQRLATDVQKLKTFEETLYNSLSIDECVYFRKNNKWLNVRIIVIKEDEITLQNECTDEKFSIVI